MINFEDHTFIQGDLNLNQFKVVDEIGQGNAHVFSIKVGSNIYAMKQIQIKNDYEYQSFLKEISIMKETADLNSAMIKYHGYFVSQCSFGPFSKIKYAHIIMECAKMNLQDLITRKISEKKYFTKTEILAIIEFMINAFEKLEKNNIAHCDIKPENILIMDEKNMIMKICDVGSCRVINSQNIQEATILGTFPFLAPELIHTKSKKIMSANPFKSDVYSFGLVLLYCILFKRFNKQQRQQVEEGVYFEIISMWIREALQLMNYDSRISQILKIALQFDGYKRPLFKQIKQIYEAEKKRKRLLYESRLKKLMDEETISHKATEQTFRSTRVGKLTLIKSRNITTKLGSRTAGIDFPRVVRKQSLGSSPKSPSYTPLSKRKSSCMSSSPEKQKFNVSMLEYKKVIYITDQEKDMIPFDYIQGQQKNFVLFTSCVEFNKAETVTIYPDCSLGALYLLASVECQKLYIDYAGNEGVCVGEDVPLLKFRKVYLNLSDSSMMGDHQYLFRCLCGIELQSFEIKLSNSDISIQQIFNLLDKLNSRALKNLGIVWEYGDMTPEQHIILTEKISKLSIQKLTLVLNENIIEYEKQYRWPLPKNLEVLYLELSKTRMKKIINNLCISLQGRPLKKLHLNLSKNDLDKGLCNFIIKTISGMKNLERVMINLSMNPLEDISYMVGALLDMKTINSIDLKFNGCNISPQKFFQALSDLKSLFDHGLKILKLAYDRKMKKAEFIQNIEIALDYPAGLKIDVIGHDHKCFIIFIKKSKITKTKKQRPPQPSMTLKAQKEKQLKIEKPIKSGCCTSLIHSQETYENYLCLSCSDLRQLSKNQYFCKFCIENCAHKGHNIVKVYERKRCSCAYSGYCNSNEFTKKMCAQKFQIKIKQQFQCDKCQKRFCNACIQKCKQNHKNWITESKETVYFECGSSL